jgi:cytochrome c
VQKHNLSFLTGVPVEIAQENGDNKEVKYYLRVAKSGGELNRSFRIVSRLALFGVFFVVGSILAQTSSKKSTSGNSAAVTRGKSLFQQKCAICHYDNSEQKKIGPGLKGISKRGTFTVNGNKITDDSLKTWIENGDQLMPPFKEVLEAAQVKDVIAYVKTL